MADTRYGATLDEWREAVKRYPHADLLPVVARPDATVASASSLSGPGKLPSRYNADGHVVGIGAWTTYEATKGDIEGWAKQPDYGICVQTRGVHALDVDANDPREAAEIEAMLAGLLGPGYARRGRQGSSKFLIPVKVTGEGEPLRKKVVKIASGAIEFLATGQQFVAYGTHVGGARYEWTGERVADLTRSELESVIKGLDVFFGTAPVSEAPASDRAKVLAEAAHADPVAAHLVANGYVIGRGRNGELRINCPWSDEHEGEGNASSTVYYPAHTGGFTRGHFKCLHSACDGARTDGAFLQRVDAPGLAFTPMAVALAEARAAVSLGSVEPALAPRGAVADKRRITSVADFVGAKPLPWLVKGIIPRAPLAMIYGASGSGKSFFALDLCAHLANGIPWRGRKTKPSRVVYLAAEGVGGLRNRVSGFLQHRLPVVGANGGSLSFLADAPDFLKADVVKALGAELKEAGCDVLVVDTLARVMAGGNENEGRDMGEVIKACGLITTLTGATVILIHHSGKDSGKGARGWGGLTAAVDAEIEVSRAEDGVRLARVTKGKDGADGDAFGFRLKQVELAERDEDGDAITTCVVEECDAPADTGRKGRPQGAAAVMDAFVERAVLATTAVTGRAGHDDVCREVERTNPAVQGDPTARADVMHSLARLAIAGRIGWQDDQVTFTGRRATGPPR